MKYLILGGNGQLGQNFKTRLEEKNEIIVADLKECDVTKKDQLNNLIKTTKADILINCSAYNLVDLAEGEGKEQCYAVNKYAPANMAEICSSLKIPFIHYSSDYVFSGSKKNGLYNETDQADPLNHYGLSKLEGEKLIQERSDNYLIFRTSWVYGPGQQNFIYKLQNWSKNNAHLNITCDEFSIPTSTETLVKFSLKALTQGLTGLYHLTNSGYCSRYEFTKEYLRLTNNNLPVYPTTREEFNLAAARPFFSPLNNKNLVQELGQDIADWQDALAQYVRN